jgi:hypothetical protein
VVRDANIPFDQRDANIPFAQRDAKIPFDQRDTNFMPPFDSSFSGILW